MRFIHRSDHIYLRVEFPQLIVLVKYIFRPLIIQYTTAINNFKLQQHIDDHGDFL